MLKISKNNKNYEFNFEGLKILNCNNTTKLYKQWFLNSVIQIDNKTFNKEDIVYVSELTKISDFFNFTKKSFLMEMIQKAIADHKIINCELINDVVKTVNQNLSFDLLIQKDGDISKIIQLIFEILNDYYLNATIFESIMKHLTKRKLFILDNVSWLNLNLLLKYINYHNFIVLTNDFRGLIINKDTIELVVNVKDNDDYVEFSDSKILFDHLEKEMQLSIDNQKFDDFIKKPNSLFSLQLFSKIKLI